MGTRLLRVAGDQDVVVVFARQCVAGLALLDESAPGALTRVWLVAGVWIGVRAAFGMARIWPGIGASPFRS